MNQRTGKGRLEWEAGSYDFAEITPWGHVEAWNQPATATWEARAYDFIGDEIAAVYGELSMEDALAKLAERCPGGWTPPQNMGL